MATETEQLVVALEARIRDFERNFQKANKTANDNFSRIENRARQSSRRLEQDMGKASANVLAGFQKMGAGIGRIFGIAGVAGGATAGGIIAAIKSAASSLAEVRAEAQRAGLASEVFQELAFAAEQSHVKIEALTDGMKELQLRADEFIVTGKGPAAEAFGRIGLSPAELKTRLRDPADLLTEIIRRVQAFDKASQIRIFDELFGGTGGEQFVRFLERGAEGMAELRKQARDTGNVLSDDVLKRAEEIDRKFDEITRTVGTRLKGAIVSVVASLQDFWKALNPERKGTVLEQSLTEIEKTIAGVRTRIAEAEKMHNKAMIGDLQRVLTDLEAQRAELRRAVNVLNFGKGMAADAPAKPAPFVPPPKSVPADLQKEFDRFIEAGAEARLSAYEKALTNVDDAYAELTKKVTDAGLAAGKEREMLHLLEVAREAQLSGIRAQSEAEELAVAKVERAQAAMAGELAILSDTSKSYDQITEALKKFNFEKELGLELEKQAKELRGLGVSEEDIGRLTAAQRELAESTFEARDAYDKLGKAQAEAKQFAQDIAQEFGRAASSIIFDATSIVDAMDRLAQAIVEATVQAAIIKPVTNAITKGIESGGSGSFADTFAGLIGLFGGLFGPAGAKGLAFNRGSVVPMAKGGILTGPTAFPMRSGKLALGGELDDEAILPLRRLPNGDLGVGAARSRETPPVPVYHVSVHQKIMASDPNAFRATLGQQAAQARRVFDTAFRRNG